MISIIGTGRVGSAIAFLAASESVDDIMLLNRTKEKAMGHVMDISSATSLDSPVSVSVTENYNDIVDSKVIVIAASTGVYENNRIDVLPQHVNLIREIAKKINKTGSQAKVVIVTNPLDVLTYVYYKQSPLDRKNIMGVASSLDCARFRYILARELHVKTSNISDCLVIGEHGDSMTPIFSMAKLNNSPIIDKLSDSQIEKITIDVINYWKILRKFKGPSIYGIAKNTVDVVRAIINDEDLSVPVSTLLDGEYGLTDVSIGVPAIINGQGVSKIQELSLSKFELDSFHKSAEIVKSYIALN